MRTLRSKCSKNDEVNGCFNKVLAFNYQMLIDDFFIKFLKLGISVTPKVHAVKWHLPEIISMHGAAAGFYSEQASEQVHHAFNARCQ